MKLLYKSILTIFASTLLAQNLSADTTLCYKNNWKSPSTIETIKLDGGECKGELTYKDMLKKGWFLKDIKITTGENGLNYTYLLSNEEVIKIDNSKFISNEYTKLQYNQKSIEIENISGENATINMGDLQIGQSAIIQHFYSKDKSAIVANAYVVNSNPSSSTLKIVPFLDLKQNALPTSNRKVTKGDTAILNYLYDSSLIIAPSQDAFLAVKAKYKDNNFLHSDIFAAKLKIEHEPLPSKETIQKFAISQNIGTIFFVIKSNIYIVDTKTFALLESDTISYNFIQNEKMPFYTRVEEIEANPFDSILDFKKWLSYIDSFIGDDLRSEEEILLEDEIKSNKLVVKGIIYNNYYKTLLGLKK